MRPHVEERPPWILPVIVLSQFAGTSLWFAGNAIIMDLPAVWEIQSSQVGIITSAVQLGFIVGTLMFAGTALADRFSPRGIYFVCSLLGAVTNLAVLVLVNDLHSLLIVRFLAGLFLAGIYPIGMKIAAGWYREGLGKALGFLVGALVLGTASPHLVHSFDLTAGWRFVVVSTSVFAFLGGLATLLFVPNGPYSRTTQRLNLRAINGIFAVREVRASVFSYFGHMWEIYTLWAFVPLLLTTYFSLHPDVRFNVPFWSFCVIASGFLGCSIGGLISNRVGSARVAFIQLFFSGLCCLLIPVCFSLPFPAFAGVMVFWGIVAAGDSPQFSAMTAKFAPGEFVGSALTISNCIGFAISIVSIQVTTYLSSLVPHQYLALHIAAGPAIGLFFLRVLLKSQVR